MTTLSLMTRDESAMTLSVSLWLVDGGAPRALPSSSELPELLSEKGTNTITDTTLVSFEQWLR